MIVTIDSLQLSQWKKIPFPIRLIVECCVLYFVRYRFFCGGNGLFWPDRPAPIKTDPIITRSTAPTPEPNRRYPTSLPTLSLPQQQRNAPITKDIINATAAELVEQRRRRRSTDKPAPTTKQAEINSLHGNKTWQVYSCRCPSLPPP